MLYVKGIYRFVSSFVWLVQCFGMLYVGGCLLLSLVFLTAQSSIAGCFMQRGIYCLVQSFHCLVQCSGMLSVGISIAWSSLPIAECFGMFRRTKKKKEKGKKEKTMLYVRGIYRSVSSFVCLVQCFGMLYVGMSIAESRFLLLSFRIQDRVKCEVKTSEHTVQTESHARSYRGSSS